MLEQPFITACFKSTRRVCPSQKLCLSRVSTLQCNFTTNEYWQKNFELKRVKIIGVLIRFKGARINMETKTK